MYLKKISFSKFELRKVTDGEAYRIVPSEPQDSERQQHGIFISSRIAQHYTLNENFN